MKKIFSLLANYKFILFSIILLSAILRFVNLGTYPALNADEAAIGYNAYSLIQTGKDEHGNSWPIHFQSFNDYKPGLYVYIVLPFVKFLGLSTQAVRIPAATSGVLTVLIIYFLVKEFFGKREKLALLASFLLAISPWHIHFSRGGWEVNFATFLVTFGLLFLTKSLKNQDTGSGMNFKYLLFSALLFVASFYTYHSVRVIVPLILIGIFFIYIPAFLTSWKKVLITILIALVVCIPLIGDFIKPGSLSRAQGVGLLADPGPKSRVEEQRIEHNNYSGIIAKVLHNKPINYGLAFLHNWSEHYWGEFLFLSGDEIQRNKVPEMGQLYMFEVVTVLIGLCVMLRMKSKSSWIILLWLFVAPIAAALTFQSPHALRSQNMVIPLTIISALGITKILDIFATKKYKYYIYIFLSLVIGWSFSTYLHMYYVHMIKEYPYSSQYGVSELVDFVMEKEGGYDKVLVTDRYDQPYILFLFYMKYPPDKFQGQHQLTGRDKFGFSTVSNFDKYHFSSINFENDRVDNPNTLIVGTDEEIPDESNIIKNISGQNDFLYFQVVAN